MTTSTPSDMLRSTTLGDATSTSTHDPRHLRKRVPLPSPCTTTPKFHYKMYHYRRRRPSSVQLPSPWIRQDPCTTTTPTTREQLLPLRARSAPNARVEGITPRRRPWTECMCCMRCSCLHRVRERSLHVPRFHTLTRGNPVVGSTPPSCLTRSRHASFCTGISMGYRSRYVAVASFSDSLPWHPFLPPR